MANYYFRAKTTANYSAITTAGGSGVSWSRSGSTITVTHNGHGLVNGDIIKVTVSSAEDIFPLGSYTVTRIDDNSFSLTISISNIKLISHFDGDDGAVSYNAETGQSFTFVGTAQLDTAQKKFGSAALLLDGNSDYVTLLDSDDWDLGNGDFHFGGYFRWNSVQNSGLFEQYISADSYWNADFYDNKLRLNYDFTGTEVSMAEFSFTPSNGNWYFIEWSRSGNTLYCFVDGSLIGSADITGKGFSNINSTLRVGYCERNNFYFNGWIDEIFFVKGVAGHTSTYTPYNYAFYATSGTETYENYVWYDAATAGNKYDTKPGSSDDVTITSTNQCTLSGNELAKTITINASTTLSLATFNLDVSGLTTINGTLIMGNSGAGTGLTTIGLTANSGSSLNLQTTSKINNSGNLSINNSTIFSNNNRGIYTQTADGNYDNVNTSNSFYDFIINEGVTLTLTQSSGQAQIGATSTGSLTINGIISCGNKNILLKAGSTGQITIGTNGDITGTGALYFFCTNGATFTFNRLTKLSHSGSVAIITTTVNNLVLPAWDFTGQDVIINGATASSYNRYISSGILKCNNFYISNGGIGSVTLIMSSNASLEISGNIDLNAGAGTYTTLWTKGTGTITLKGSSGTQTIDLQNLVLEDIILDCAGATKQIILGATIDSLSGTGGTLNSSVSGTQRTLICENTGVCSNIIFKDISVGSKNKVNAKNSCTNQGNCLGIVFKDMVH